MEFSSLKEQRTKAHDAAEARAAAAAASTEAESNSASHSRSSSSSSASESTSSRRRKRTPRSDTTEGGTGATEAAAVETPFGQAMANPMDQDNGHTQPLEDGSLPTPGLGSAEHVPLTPASDAANTPQTEEEPMKAHNLLQATELLQAGGNPLSPFAPAPILRLNAIRISGAGRALRPSYLASLCRPYMDPTLSTQNPNTSILNSLYYGSRTSHVLPGQPTTLPSILALTSSLAGDLDKLDVFRNIEASLAPSIFPGATEEDVDVILACGKPKGRVFLKSSTDVGNGEGSASVQGRIRNVLGGAETLQGSATFGTRTKQAFNLEFGGPLAGNPDIEYKLSAFSHDRDYSAFASLSEAVKGVRASINSSSTDEPKGIINAAEDGEATATTTQHEVAYEASLRELGRVMANASVAVRKMAVSPSVKSALSWTWVREGRDSPVLPSRGSKVRTVLEYAGLGGDAQHIKAEVEASTGRHFSPLRWLFPAAPSPSTPSPFLDEKSSEANPTSVDADSTLPSLTSSLHPIYSTLTFRSGLIHPLTSSPTHFSDRFQLGGPTSLRMFRHSSLGPKSDGDSLGGDAFWSLGLSLLSPIPRKPHWPLMLHTFFNAGQMCQFPTGTRKEYARGWRELVEPSTSAGVGLVYMQGQLRVELNAGVPLTARKGDGTSKGLQLGIGIDFL
ncbi:Sorting assembly machinery 50 kDa subunit [Pseudozyma hubeiensis]|nr:Sorting assembly machinery 50 kDa subunit [Pseudozyma hubeiensis]